MKPDDNNDAPEGIVQTMSYMLALLRDYVLDQGDYDAINKVASWWHTLLLAIISIAIGYLLDKLLIQLYFALSADNIGGGFLNIFYRLFAYPPDPITFFIFLIEAVVIGTIVILVTASITGIVIKQTDGDRDSITRTGYYVMAVCMIMSLRMMLILPVFSFGDSLVYFGGTAWSTNPIPTISGSIIMLAAIVFSFYTWLILYRLIASQSPAIRQQKWKMIGYFVLYEAVLFGAWQIAPVVSRTFLMLRGF